jgi:hypothetical protein
MPNKSRDRTWALGPKQSCHKPLGPWAPVASFHKPGGPPALPTLMLATLQPWRPPRNPSTSQPPPTLASPNVQDLFNAHDMDSDGELDRNELARLLRSVKGG